MKLFLKLPDLEQKYFARYICVIIHTLKRKTNKQKNTKRKPNPKPWGFFCACDNDFVFDI